MGRASVCLSVTGRYYVEIDEQTNSSKQTNSKASLEASYAA